MPLWLILLAISIATTVIGELLKPKQQKPTAGALGDFNFPTAEEGRAIPYVCGTVNIKGGNTTWWGDLKVKPIKKKASFLSFSSQTVGYQYFIGVQYALCHGPIDALIQIRANKKAVPYTTSVISNGAGSEDRIKIIATGDKLFGGTDVGGEGGFSGTMDFYRGLQTQQPNDYLTRVQGRVAVVQSGLPYVYAGIGDGVISFLSGGSAAKNETITATATSVSGGHMHFTLDGSVSGHIGTVIEGTAFTSGEVNITITAGATAFVTGDRFTFQTAHANAAPAYLGICYLVLEQCYTGTTNYPKPIEVILRRCPDPFAQGSAIANIGGDANPVLVIYELMTNNFYGLGIPVVRFDAASFMAAAITIATEAIGVSFQQDSLESADSIIGEVLRHIDGLIYTDPTTGLWTIKLTRNDYDPSTLLLLDESNAIEAIDFARGSWDETTNNIILSYLSRAANYNTRTVMDYDRANIEITREVRTESVDYKFLSNPAAAALVATRHLKTLSSPIAKIKLVCNRDAYSLRMGSPFKLSWAALGISNAVCRVAQIAFGEVRDGKITIEAVEDIFGVSKTAFDSPPSSGWIDPLGAPQAPSQQRLWESPYKLQADAGADPGRYAIALVKRGDATSKTFEIWNTETTPYESVDFAAFQAAGILTANYGLPSSAADLVGFSVDSVTEFDAEDMPVISDADFNAGKYLALIDDELIGFQVGVFTGGVLAISKVWRAVLDTVPGAHAAGTPVYFLFLGAITTKASPELADTTMSSKFLPENSAGLYPIASATNNSLTTRSRYLAPYPPGNIRINAGSWGVVPGTITADLSITWAVRNRLTQLSLVRQDAGDVAGGGEVGQTYTVKVFIGATLKQNVGGLTGGAYTYTQAQRVIDDPDVSKAVTVQIFANANGVDSYFFQGFTLHMSGPAGTLGSGRYEFATVDEGGLLL